MRSFISDVDLKSKVRCFDTKSGPKFTDDLTTILRQFSDLRQSYDNGRIHRTFTTIVRLILRQNLMITIHLLDVLKQLDEPYINRKTQY